ncbi:hypothetical protein SAMN05421754_10755 [Nitrosomonas sp. Nm58]|nr:hypothetical protein SAMN05421754_10755 [Nitrosomonas sp. Nm58]
MIFSKMGCKKREYLLPLGEGRMRDYKNRILKCDEYRCIKDEPGLFRPLSPLPFHRAPYRNLLNQHINGWKNDQCQHCG